MSYDLVAINKGNYTMSDTYGLNDRFAQDKDGNTVLIAKVGDPKPAYSAEAVEAVKEKTIGEQMRFQLGWTVMMWNCGRDEAANKSLEKLQELINTVD
jgi:hypothetical protein